MSLLIESIRVDDGVVNNLELHQNRINSTRSAIWGIHEELNINDAIQNMKPEPGSGIWKIRILYNRVIHHVDCMPYKPASWKTASLVDGKGINYTYKWADRKELEILNQAARKAGTDTALIIRNGYITDFTYANVALFDGRLWWTPTQPLLMGTRRHHLLETGRIQTSNISPDDIPKYERICPINAMLDLHDTIITINSWQPL